jgi:ankyrin repeat protein
MNISSFLHHLSRSIICRLSVALLVALAWSIPAFCGPIFEAAYAGDLETIKMLLGGNPSLVSSKDAAGDTPLHFAALKGHKDVVVVLLAYGAEVNAKDNYADTALHAAAAGGHKNVVEVLLANKADVNARDNDGDTPMHAAAAGGNKDVIELLRWHGGHE